MKAITVRQPWAHCIIIGEKPVENRARTLGPHRGLIAIHAGAAWSPEGATDERCITAWHGVDMLPPGARPLRPGDFAFGAIIGVAQLTGMHHVTPGCCTSEWADMDYAGAPVGAHLTLAHPYRLAEPIPCRGQLGLWTLPADVEAALHLQLDADGGEPRG